METFESLVRAEFAPKNTYLNTAAVGLLPSRAVHALRTAVESVAAGQPPTCSPTWRRPGPRSPG